MYQGLWTRAHACGTNRMSARAWHSSAGEPQSPRLYLVCCNDAAGTLLWGARLVPFRTTTTKGGLGGARY
jgi:hypothetical protein